MIRKIFILLLLCCTLSSASADEGLWLPSLIGQRIKDMRQKGLKLSAEDIYSINKASMKDAVLLFGTGSTASFISGDGLLLTNHHCAVSYIRKLSSPQHNYIENGFWAMSYEEELPAIGLSVRRLVRMDDVTERIATGELAEDIINDVRKDGYEASVVPMYYGNQQLLVVYEVFKDVRLVAAPPASIGMFGSDTDCWFWPRHTGDFAILRVYADENNSPAEYSENNRPYRPLYHLPISTKGVAEGDFTMVYGYPSSTQEYVTSHAIEYIVERSNPMKIDLREKRLEIISAEQARSEQSREALTATRASLSKILRRWQGEVMGLQRAGSIAKRKAYEQEFAQWAKTKPEYAFLLDSMAEAYSRIVPEYYLRELYTESVGAVSIFNFARTLGIALRNENSNDVTLAKQVAKFNSSYIRSVDEPLAVVMLEEFLRLMPSEKIPSSIKQCVQQQGGARKCVEWLFANTSILNSSQITKQQLKEDVLVVFAMGFDPIVKRNSRYAYSSLSRVPAIAKWYPQYIQALREWDKMSEGFYPDANRTLRLSYGRVEGCEYADGEYYNPITTLDGVIAKSAPDVYDYNTPKSFVDIFNNKDYGRWGAEIGGKKSVPVCFMTTAHTSGGNSGSPMVNGKGQLVGINFHRTLHTAMSDTDFDASICRNVAVDIRYVLFVVEHIGRASYLLEEMDLR